MIMPINKNLYFQFEITICDFKLESAFDDMPVSRSQFVTLKKVLNIKYMPEKMKDLSSRNGLINQIINRSQIATGCQ